MTDTIDERRDRGAALMDDKRPGWDTRTDLDLLDMGSCYLCVVGQEYSAYRFPFTAGADDLFGPGADGDDIAPYGFELYSDDEAIYDDLTESWRRLILARRAGSEAAGER